MAYDVTKTNTERLAIVDDRTVETSSSSIGLIGKNYTNHGEIIAENLVHMLENFNSFNPTKPEVEPLPPKNPIIGQLWYENFPKADPVENLNVYTGCDKTWQRVNPNLTKVEDKSSAYTISELDHGSYLRIDSTTLKTITLPNTASIPVGTSVIIVRVGTGDVVISAADGAVVEPQNLPKMIANRFGRITAIKVMQSSGVSTWEIDATADKLSSETWNIIANPSMVDEGGTVTWTITSNALPGTYYWSIEQTGGISGADFTNTAMSGTFALVNGTATVTKTLSNDTIVEGSETITFNVAKTQGGVAVKTSTVIVADKTPSPDGSTTEPTPAPTPAPTPEPTPAPTPAPDDGSVNNNTSAIMLANYFWINRSSLVRYGTSGDSYPGDNYSVNNPNARFVTSFRNMWTYSNSVLPGSTYFTVISLATGAIGNGGGITTTVVEGGTLSLDLGSRTYVGDGPDPTNTGNNYGISYDVKIYQGSINEIISNSIVSKHAGGNKGAWTYSYILPQRWNFVSSTVNFEQSTYTATLNPGDIHFTLIERGGDYGYKIVQPNGISNNMTVDNWWYNGGGVQCSVNTSSSPVTISYPPTVTEPVNGEFEIPGSTTYDLNAWTPRIAGILRKLD